MTTNWQAHSVFAAWSSLAVSLLALIVSCAGGAFTALQTSAGRNVVCGVTGSMCDPSNMASSLWTLERYAGPSSPSPWLQNGATPPTPDQLGPMDSPPSDVWNSYRSDLRSNVKSVAESFEFLEAGESSYGCVPSIPDIAGGDDYEVNQQYTRLGSDRFVIQGVGDKAILPEANLPSNRRLLVEIQLDFPRHWRPIQTQIQVQSFFGFWHLERLDVHFDPIVPPDVESLQMLCALPSYLPGHYQYKIVANSGVGDKPLTINHQVEIVAAAPQP